MKRFLLLTFGAIIFCASVSYAQPAFTIQNKKDACDGLNNGSFEVLVSSANTPPLRVFVFGPPDQGPINATVGVPLTISGLQGGKSYLVVVQDADGSNVRFENINIIPTGITPTIVSTTNNSSCSSPAGAIDIDVTGGTGSFTYAWSGPGGFTDPGTQDLNNLAGGNYSLFIRDNGTNCTRTFGPIVITDPSPILQTITTTSPQSICSGQNVSISLGNSEGPPVQYQVLINGVASGAPQTNPGGGPFTITVPAASISNNDVLTIQASHGACTPIMMSGSVTVNVNPIPTAPSVAFSPAYCVGETIIPPTINSPNGGSTYSWYSDVSLLNLIATGPNPTNAQLGFSSASPTSVNVYVRETSAANCTGPATLVSLTVSAVPGAPNINFSTPVVCVGDAISPPTVVGPVAGSTYTWYSDALLTSVLTTSATPTNAALGFSSASPTTRTVYVRETTSAGCSGPASSVELNVIAAPNAPAVTFLQSTYCVGETITPPTITSPVGGSTYTWYSNVTLTNVLTTGTTPTNAQLGFSSATANSTTVYVRETSSNGCSGPATPVPLTVNAVPVAPTIQFNPAIYCVGESITSPTVQAPNGSSTYSWFSDAGLTILLTTGVSPTNAQLGFSSATVNVTRVYVRETSAASCTGPATEVTLTVNATPTAPDVNFTQNTYCVGETITPPTINSPVATSTYTWYSNNTLTNVLTTGTTPTAAQLGFSTASANSTTVYVRETTSSNCPGPATLVTLTVNALPDAPTVNFNPHTYCVGQAITAPTIASPVGGSTYQWYSDAALTTLLTTGTTPTNAQLGFSSASANITRVYVRQRTASNCTGPATEVTLTVNATPAAPAVTFSPTSYCVGQTINAPSITTPQLGSTYTWYSNPGLTTVLTTGTNPSAADLGFSSATANTRTVYVRETNAGGCPGTATPVTLTVTSNPGAPGVTFSPNTYCVGDAINAPVITTPQAGRVYTWYSDAALTSVLFVGTNPTNAVLNFSSAASGITRVYVTQTTPANCTSPSRTVTLTVSTPPTSPVINFNPNTYCVGQTMTSAPTVSAPVGGSTYRWYSNATLTNLLFTGTAPSNAQLGFNTASAGTITVYVTRTVSGCASAPTSVMLTVNPLPNAPDVTFNPSSYCVGETITPPSITTPDGGSTYTWFSDALLTNVLATGPTPTNAQLGFSSASATTRSVFVRETSASNCSGPATEVTLTVSTIPAAPPVTFSSNYCVGETITPPTITSPVVGNTYTWYSDPGLLNVIATGTSPTAAQLGFSSAAANSTTVYVTRATGSGCSSPATSVILNVYPVPGAPAVLFTDDTYCVGETITPPTIDTPTPGSSYAWYSDAGLTALLVSSTTPSAAQLNFSTAAANITTVYVREITANNCAGPATSVELTVNANPSILTVNFPTPTICVGETITAPSIPSADPTSTFSWYSDALLTNVIATGTSPTNAALGFSNATAGSTTVYVRETNLSGCPGNTVSVTLTVNEVPVPVISFDGDYCVGETIIPPTINSPTGGSVYSWYADAGLATLLTTGPTPSNIDLGFSSAVATTRTVYLVETTTNNCTNIPLPISLTVNDSPSVPTVLFNSQYCVGDAIVAPEVDTPDMNSTYSWYSDLALNNLIATGPTPSNAALGFSSAAPNQTTVYLVERNAANCASTPVAVELNVTTTPNAPIISFAKTNYCVGETITPPSVSSPNGTSTYTWYANPGLTTILATGPAPSNAQLNFSTAVPTSVTVYVQEVTASNCESAVSEVTLNVFSSPGIPSITFAKDTYCVGEVINPPTVDGPDMSSTYTWYSNALLTNVLFVGPNPTAADIGFTSAVPNSTTVYVTETNASNCASTAAAITITVNEVPTAPAVTFSPTTYCVGSTITAPVITSPGAGTYTWYSESTLMNAIASGPTPANNDLGFNTTIAQTVEVFVVYTLNGCTSAATQVTLNVIDGIDTNKPLTASIDPLCVGGSSNVQVGASQVGILYQLREQLSGNTIGGAIGGNGGTIALATGSLSVTTTFFVEASAGGCPTVVLDNTITINVAGSIDATFALTALDNPICVGEATTIRLESSELNVDYQLRDNENDTPIGTAMTGTGGPIDFPTGPLTATTSFNILASNAVCSIVMNDVETVGVNTSPNATTLVEAVDDPICSGGSTSIRVVGSEAGVSYQLRDDNGDVNIGSPVIGNGGNILLPTGTLTATTVFNVLATGAPGCASVELSTLVTINVTGAINAGLAVAAVDATICQGSSTSIRVSASEVGVQYQLRDHANNNAVGTPVNGTGGDIDLPTGTLNATTVFNVLVSNASCSITLANTATVNVDIAPDKSLTTDATITPLCEGGISEIRVYNSQTGVSYQLRNGTTDVGSPVAGTGGTILLSTGSLTATTTFNILATGGATCPSEVLDNTVIVVVNGTVNAGLTTTAVTSPICAGQSTAIEVLSSEVGVNYRLRIGTTFVGGVVAGTGGTIQLPTDALTATTTFNVLASNGACSIQLTDTEEVVVTPSPNAALTVNANPALICSGSGSTVVVLASQTGVTYQLRNNADNSNVGGAIISGGGDISFAVANITATSSYNVLATLGSCSTSLTQVATVTVRAANDPVCGGGGGACPALTSIQVSSVSTTCADPDNGSLTFTLPGSYDVIVQNQIFRDNPADPEAVSVTQRGNTLTFGSLKANQYFYTIRDLAGTTCVTDFTYTLEKETVVKVTSKSIDQSVTCFGDFAGTITLGATGTTTGKYFYEFTHNGYTISNEFTIGAPITGIPATDNNYLVIKVDESPLFACPDTVMVRVRHITNQIQFGQVATTAVSACNGSDGAITIQNITGGAAPLQIQLVRQTNLGTTPVGTPRSITSSSISYDGLVEGTYFFVIRDANNCAVNNLSAPINVTAPGSVSFTLSKRDADCSNDANSGQIFINNIDPGNYLVAITTNPEEEPTEFSSRTYTGGPVFISFNNLARGKYFVYLKANVANSCPFVQSIDIEGAYAVNFEVQRVCGTGTAPTINLVNVTGDPNAKLEVKVFSTSNLGTAVDDFIVDYAEVLPITYLGTPTATPHDWLTRPDDYFIVITQNQGCESKITSPQVMYAVSQELSLLVDNIQPSIPDRQSGAFTLRHIVGGMPMTGASGSFFSVSVIDPGTNTPLFGPFEVVRNAQGRFERTFRNMPVGTYRLEVTDAYGCTVTSVVIIPADSRLIIPNVFTPNGDTVNDTFEIVNLPGDGKHKIVITNRWGKQVFASNDYREGTFWDAGEAPEGIYFYRLQVSGGQTYSGWVELIRGTKP